MVTQTRTEAMPAATVGAGSAPRNGAMGSLCRISDIPKQAGLGIRLASGGEDRSSFIRRVWALRKRVYQEVYPEVVGVEDDPYDDYACVIYTQDADGEVTSTARIAFDGALGIPEAAMIPYQVERHHAAGTRFAELGRFVIDDEARGVLPNYYRAFYELGAAWDVEMYFMFVPDNKIKLYRRIMDAQVVQELPGVTFGSTHEYVCMEWWLERTPERFFSWCAAMPRLPMAVAEEGGR